MKLFRLLKPNEIECRVQKATQKGVVLLLYKTARTDADLLDETFGPTSWENDFKLVDGVLYGGIGITYPFNIHFDDGNSEHLVKTIWKWDAGTESNTEAEKGRASDAFKRAGFKWGIGRELYSAPFTFVPAGKCTVKEVNGRYVCYDPFDVADIQYDENERICYLRIEVKGDTVFEWGSPYVEPSHGEIFCEDCGRPIRDSKKKDGSPWYAAEVAAYTKSFSGRCLCADCGKVERSKMDERPIR